MSKMEELKFMVDLDWRMRFEKIDKIFSNHDFFERFFAWLSTDTGKKWLTKENGRRYLEWQTG